MNTPYQSPIASLEPKHSPRSSTGLAVLGIAVSALPAVTCWFVLGKFQETFQAFGVQLPWLSRVVLSYHGLLWLVPAGIAALAVLAPAAWRGRRAAALGVASGLILMPVCVIAMYLPVFKLGAVVG